MRRDMDLVRDLMLKLEASEPKPGVLCTISPFDEEVMVDGRSTDEIDHHLSMIYKAGFVDYGSGPMIHQSGDYPFRGLTSQGHDFLDAVREPKVWTETKTRAEKVGGWTVGILTDLAKGYLKAKAAEHGFPLG